MKYFSMNMLAFRLSMSVLQNNDNIHFYKI